jgi:hypothetical protein
MSIQDTIPLDKSGLPIRYPLIRAIFWPLSALLLIALGFGIGELATARVGGVEIRNDPSLLNDPTAQAQAQVSQSATAVFASSQGKRYYYSNCKSTVSAKNKVTFATPALAEAAGYTLATNCQAP